jgi:enoyl-CoA hydratase
MTTELLIEDCGAVRVLTMNRPEKRNALNHALTQALVDALTAADNDESIGSIVLAGAGQGFCAGADMSEFKDLTPDRQHLVEARATLSTSLHALFPKLNKPVITAIQGAAMGGGAGLALAGDLAVAAHDAKIGYPEVKHGIVAAIVMTNLVRQLGRKQAFELVALGEPVSGTRALELGMVNRAVSADELLPTAIELATRMAAMSHQAMAATKSLFYEVLELDFDAAIMRGRDGNARMRSFKQSPNRHASK